MSDDGIWIKICTKAIIVLAILSFIIIGISIIVTNKVTQEKVSLLANIESKTGVTQIQDLLVVTLKNNKVKTKETKKDIDDLNEPQYDEEITNSEQEIDEEIEQDEESIENTIQTEGYEVEENNFEIEQEELKNDLIEEEISVVSDELTQEENIQSQMLNEETIGIVEIPKTGVNLPIYKQITIEKMEEATCLLYSTGELNKTGNNMIIGHNKRNGTLFSDNKYLEQNDEIYITSRDGQKQKYVIYSKFTTTPEDITYLQRKVTGTPEITLQCCSDNEQQRIIILAKAI